MTRPFVTHEQQVMGSLATADVLQAVDTPLQDGIKDWNALAPMASLMGAGDVLVQYDQAYERYDTPNPQQLALDLAVTPPGLSDPVSYGTPRPNVPLVPHFDEATLARPADQGWTSPLVSYTVADPRPIERAESTSTPLVVDGDADGIVNAAAVGLLADNPSILYAGTLDTDARLRSETLGAPADLVVTDTNRKQGYRVEHAQREHRVHRDGGPGPGHERPHRCPPQPLPQGPGRRPDHRRPPRALLGHRLVLRVVDHLPPRGSPVGRPGRQPPLGLAHRLDRLPDRPVVAGRAVGARTRWAASSSCSRNKASSTGPSRRCASPSTAVTRCPCASARRRRRPPARSCPSPRAPSAPCASP